MPQIAAPIGAYIASCDEKSAYDGIRLHVNSRTYFGIQFAGWYLVYNTLPFGFKLSPYIYQTVGMSFLRYKGIRCLKYIDNRLVGPFVAPKGSQLSSAHCTDILAFWTINLLNELGYTLTLHKSNLVPTQCLVFLGLRVETLFQRFSLPTEKR